MTSDATNCGCDADELRAQLARAERERDDLLVWAVELKADAMAKRDPIQSAITHYHRTDAKLLRKENARLRQRIVELEAAAGTLRSRVADLLEREHQAADDAYAMGRGETDAEHEDNAKQLAELREFLRPGDDQTLVDAARLLALTKATP